MKELFLELDRLNQLISENLRKEQWDLLVTNLERMDQILSIITDLKEFETEDQSDENQSYSNQFIQKIKHAHAENLVTLQQKRELFYGELKLVGRKVKASQVYNNMKRL